MKKWTLEIKEYEGDSILEFTDEMLKEVGWKEGDVLEWIDNKDGSWTLKKKEIE